MYASIFQKLPQPAWILDSASLRVLASNDAAERLCGLLPEGIGVHSPTGLLAPVPRDGAAPGGSFAVMRYARRKDGVTMAFRMQSRSIPWGETAVQLVTAEQMPDAAGTHAGEVEAQPLSQYFRQVFESTPGVCLVLSVPGFRVLAVSDDLLVMMKLARDEIVGRHLFDVVADEAPPGARNKGARATLRGSLERVCATRQTDILPVQRQLMRRTGEAEAPGQMRFWCPIATPIFAARGGLQFIVLRFDDVTAFVQDRVPRAGQRPQPPAGDTARSAIFRSRELDEINLSIHQKDAWLAESQRIADIGYWELDLQTNEIRWTDPVYEIYGVSKDSFAPTASSVRALLHPEDVAEATGARSRTVANNTTLENVHRIIRPDGTVRYIKQLGRVTSGRSGPKLSGVVRDITESYLAEQNAASATRLLEAAGRLALFGGWRFRIGDDHVQWTKETSALFDCAPYFVPSLKEATELVLPEYRPKVVAALQRCVTEGSPFDLVVEARTKTGRVIWVRSTGEAERDASGRVVAVHGATQGVSDLVEAKRESDVLRHRLEQTFEAISEAFFLLDSDWKITFLNANAAGFLDREKEDLLGRQIWDACPELAGNDFEACCRDAVATQRPVQASIRQGGSRRHVEVRAYPTFPGLSVYFKDVTAQHQRESQLHLLREAVSRVNDLVVITDAGPDTPQGAPRIVYVNEAFYRKTGYTPAEVIGQTPRILNGPKTQKAALGRIKSAMRDSRPVRTDMIQYTKDGREFWVEVDIVPIFAAGGTVRHWVAIQRDISERKAAEVALKISDERFNLVARATNDVVWDWQIETDTLWWNDSAQGVFGYAGGTVAPGLARWRAAIHPDDLERFDDSLQSALETDATTWLCEYRFRRRDGSYATVMDKCYIGRDKTGRALRMVGSMSDVSETRRLELGMREAAKLEAMGRLTGGIAHDFNNMLTIILGTADLLLESTEDRPKLQKMVMTTIAAAERGSELTRHLLAFARQQPLVPRPVDVNQVLSEAMPLFRQAVDAGIELRFVPARQVWFAMIDAGQLVNAVLNLVINSRDAMAEGGRIIISTANVDTTLAERCDGPAQEGDGIDGEYVLVSVSDSGSGMTEEVMSRAFEPFFTTKGPSMGSGLGLSMVYGLMKQSRGHARIHSRPQEGATVRLYIPRTLQQPKGLAAGGPEDAVLGQGEHILMAEDDLDLGVLVRGQLASLGYRVTAVENAAEALEVLAREPDIRLLFTDIMMPGELNGHALAREARRLYPGLKVLLTSGYAEDMASPDVRPNADIDLLKKPYRMRDLARAIDAALSAPPRAEV